MGVDPLLNGLRVGAGLDHLLLQDHGLSFGSPERLRLDRGQKLADGIVNHGHRSG
jgi:hypothetical protein